MYIKVPENIKNEFYKIIAILTIYIFAFIFYRLQIIITGLFSLFFTVLFIIVFNYIKYKIKNRFKLTKILDIKSIYLGLVLGIILPNTITIHLIITASFAVSICYCFFEFKNIRIINPLIFAWVVIILIFTDIYSNSEVSPFLIEKQILFPEIFTQATPLQLNADEFNKIFDIRKILYGFKISDTSVQFPIAILLGLALMIYKKVYPFRLFIVSALLYFGCNYLLNFYTSENIYPIYYYLNTSFLFILTFFTVSNSRLIAEKFNQYLYAVLFAIFSFIFKRIFDCVDGSGFAMITTEILIVIYLILKKKKVYEKS